MHQDREKSREGATVHSPQVEMFMKTPANTPLRVNECEEDDNTYRNIQDNEHTTTKKILEILTFEPLASLPLRALLFYSFDAWCLSSEEGHAWARVDSPIMIKIENYRNGSAESRALGDRSAPITPPFQFCLSGDVDATRVARDPNHRRERKYHVCCPLTKTHV